MRVVAVRHFSTRWTDEERLQGRRDEPLRRPVVPDPSLAERLRPFAGQTAWCSTLLRTRETAALCGWTAPVATPLLDELDFGPFEGRTRDELMAATQGDWGVRPFSTSLRPALEELEERVRRFRDLVRAGQGPPLLFGHGIWIRALATLAAGRPRDTVNQMALHPGGVVEVEL